MLTFALFVGVVGSASGDGLLGDPTRAGPGGLVGCFTLADPTLRPCFLLLRIVKFTIVGPKISLKPTKASARREVAMALISHMYL